MMVNTAHQISGHPISMAPTCRDGHSGSDRAHSDHSIRVVSDHSKGPAFRPKACTAASNRRQQESRPNQHAITSHARSWPAWVPNPSRIHRDPTTTRLES
ncbi:hypothetical protein ACLOJK_028567 [Asimina triloba]